MTLRARSYDAGLKYALGPLRDAVNALTVGYAEKGSQRDHPGTEHI